MRKYIAQRRNEGLSESSIKRELGLLSAAINDWNRQHQADVPNPAAHQSLSEPPGRVRWLSHAQAERLIAAAQRSRVVL